MTNDRCECGSKQKPSYIQEHIRSGALELVWSYMLDFENAANPFEERRTTISAWQQYAMIDVEETAMILQRAQLLAGMGLKAKDALHIACAIAGACPYFVTTDDAILKRRQEIHDITVIDPTAFIRELNL
jgi:predicted nucleic acid-binding protein